MDVFNNKTLQSELCGEYRFSGMSRTNNKKETKKSIGERKCN